jgi:hypothetical protein
VMAPIMNKKLTYVVASFAMTTAASAAQAEDLTLCWASWDPANALNELNSGDTVKICPRNPFYFDANGARII